MVEFTEARREERRTHLAGAPQSLAKGLSTSTIMFKIFSANEKPVTSHGRSKTLSHLQQQPAGSDVLPAFDPDGNVSRGSALAASPALAESFSRYTKALVSPEHNTNTPTEPTKTHQRALTEQYRSPQNFPPLLTLEPVSRQPISEYPFDLPSTASSRQSSPTRSHMSSSDKVDHSKPVDKAAKIASWFKGESEPISVGLIPSPVKEKANPLEPMGASSTVLPTSSMQKKPTSSATSKLAMANRFSFFASKISLSKTNPQSFEHNDEFFDLDIGAALHPTGSRDPFSPASFKNLEQQAEGLLIRLQNAYRDRTIDLREMKAEKEALAEETQGAGTRAKHLKMQLDDMAVKVAEQDEAMMNLVDELAQEKLARREDEARVRSVRLVEHDAQPTIFRGRQSRSNTISDSGFESEDESSADSVFSRRNGIHSPTMSMSSVSSTTSPEAYHPPEFQNETSMPQAARLRVPPICNNGKRFPSAMRPEPTSEPQQPSCPSCNGIRSSETWGVVSRLKEENRALTQRLSELEGALDGCLDVVGR